MSGATRVRVFLVDDHHLFRSGVRAELGDDADVVGEASEVDAAIEMIGERAPDVVLVDVHMPDGGGEAVIRGVLAEHPDVRFLALSVSDAPEDVIAVIRAGARGYVTKTISGPELLDAIRRVADDDVVFSPAARRVRARRVLAGAARRRRSRSRPAHRARTRGAASHRAWLRVQGDRPPAQHLHEDGRDARVVGACASSSSRIATSSPAGPPNAASSSANVDRARKSRQRAQRVARKSCGDESGRGAERPVRASCSPGAKEANRGIPDPPERRIVRDRCARPARGVSSSFPCCGSGRLPRCSAGGRPRAGSPRATGASRPSSRASSG